MRQPIKTPPGPRANLCTDGCNNNYKVDPVFLVDKCFIDPDNNVGTARSPNILVGCQLRHKLAFNSLPGRIPLGSKMVQFDSTE